MKFSPLLISICLICCGCARTVEVHHLHPDEVMQMEIFPSRWDGPGPPPDLVTIKERDGIASILTVLEPVGDADRKSMVDRVKIVVTEKTGKKVLLQLQPGDDPGYYEYLGQGKAFRVRRGPLLEVMARYGVGWLPR